MGQRQNGPLLVSSAADKDIESRGHFGLWTFKRGIWVYDAPHPNSKDKRLGRVRGRVDKDRPGDLGRRLSWSQQSKPHPAEQPWVKRAEGVASWGTGVSGRLFLDLTELPNRCHSLASVPSTGDRGGGSGMNKPIPLTWSLESRAQYDQAE